MNRYMVEHFPFADLCRFLCFGTERSDLLAKREFMTGTGESFVRRHLSLPSSDQLQSFILREKICRFDVGASYIFPPARRTADGPENCPVLRELTFDMDLKDYDDVRGCGCSGNDRCCLCWPLVATSAVVVHRLLKEVFGYRRIMWVYSGMKGFHCWISDPEAVTLDDAARNLIFGAIQRPDSDGFDVRRSPAFLDVVRTSLVPFFFDFYLKNHAAAAESMLNSAHRRGNTARHLCGAGELTARKLRILADEWLEGGVAVPGCPNFSDVLFRTVYPRLDAAVTVQISHMMKTPFSIHRATGAASIFLAPEELLNDYRAFPVVDENGTCSDPEALRLALERFGRYSRFTEI